MKEVNSRDKVYSTQEMKRYDLPDKVFFWGEGD